MLPQQLAEPRALTGRDQAVIDHLEAEADVLRMRGDIARFLGDWLPCHFADNRGYLTVGIGCAGGRHRSGYLAEWLAGALSSVLLLAGTVRRPPAAALVRAGQLERRLRFSRYLLVSI
jgi:RNase adaptor protein for sRNA GlmZ degradation